MWGMLIFIGSSIPADSFPNSPIFTYDKVLHSGVFFVFAMLTERALRHQTRYPFLALHSGLITLLIAVFYGALDEFHQRYVPGRTPDIYDLLADTSGALLFLAVLWFIRSWRRGRSPV
jgi:VanZ family protein